MRKILLAIAATVLAAGSASAADLAARPYTKAPPIVDVYNWTGFYIGGNVGYTFSDGNDVGLSPATASFIPPFAVGQVPASIGMNRDGFIGGAQIGYNWQFSNWLLGVEADIQGVDINKSGSFTSTVLPVGVSTVTSKMDYFGTVRGRVGFLADRTLLIYGTGGLAYGEIENTFTVAFPTIPQLYTGTSKETKTGWTAGGGVEWAFTRNWTAKAEYLYYDLGTTNAFASQIAPSPAGTAAASFENTGHIVRGGVNYHF